MPVAVQKIILRDYQIKFISDVSLAHKQGHQGIIGQMPTGAGKTICMSRIAMALSERNGKVLIVVHRDELVRQTCNKLELFGLEFGIIAAKFGKNPKPYAKIQVAMVQTISRKLKLILTEFHYIIFDEAHLSAAKSHQKIIARWPKAKRLGLSATPWRLDGQGLSMVGSIVVRGPSITHLIDIGSLVPFIMYSIPVVDFTGVKKVAGEYDIEAQSVLFKKAGVVGDVVDHYIRLCRGRSCLVFASSIEHSKKLRDKFIEKGFTSEHIDGETPTAERQAVIDRLESGKTTVICNYGCLTEGFDSPRVSVIIVARKTASSSLFRQMCGRGLRPWKFDGKNGSIKKTNCIILDHGGNALDHGNLDYDYVFSLDGKDKNPSERICKECKNCGAIVTLTASKCHVCDYDFTLEVAEREVKETEGTLVAIPAGLAPVTRLNVKPEKTELEKALEKLTKIPVVNRPKTHKDQLVDWAKKMGA